MISIVIAAYNSGDSIGKTIDSVLNQTSDDWELVIVDDGSTDNTRNVISSYEDERLKYFYQANQGVTAARNFGVSKTSKDYLIFLDADDEFFKNTIEDFIQILKNNENVGIACGKYIHSPNIEAKPRNKGELFQNYIVNNLVGSYIVSKELFNSIGGYDEKLTYSENWELFIRLTKHCKTKNLKVVTGDFLTFKYNYEDSDDKNTLRTTKIIDTYTYLFKKYKNLPNQSFNYAFSFAETISFNYYKIGKRSKALSWQKVAIRSKPLNLKSYFKLIRYSLF